MSASWFQYSVQCSDGEMSEYIYDWRGSAVVELERINQILATDPELAGVTAWIVERAVEAEDWEAA